MGRRNPFGDERSMRVVVVAHCILNHNTKVAGLSTRERMDASKRLVELLISQHVGIVQMPCPEFTYLGPFRPKQTKSQYDSVGFRRHCRSIAAQVMDVVENLHHAGIEVLCVIGVEGSPTCGVSWTKVGVGGGRRVRGMGILFEELQSEEIRRGLKLRFLGLPETPKYGSLEEFLGEVRSLLGAPKPSP